MGPKYQVQSGDTLWGLAERFYGDGRLSEVISVINAISDPDHIVVGQELEIAASFGKPVILLHHNQGIRVSRMVTGSFLNIVQAASRDAQWRGLANEGYLFAAVIYFLFCFAMSRYSIYLEHKLHTGHRR